MRFRSLFLLATPLTLAACLPARDNADDPNGGANVRLYVRDISRGPTDRRCPDEIAVGATSGVIVGAASRGRCLVLDAGESTTGSNEPIAADPDARFRYLLLETAGVALASPVEIAPLAATPSVAVLDSSFRHQWTPGRTLTFQAIVESHGHRSRGLTDFVLENSPPIVVPDPVRVLPVSGPAWNPAATMPVAFSAASSSDPDGDPLRVCFTFPGEAETCRSELDPPFVRDVSTDAGEYYADVRVFDGASWSPRTRSIVSRRNVPPAWALNTDAPVPLDPARGDFKVAGSGTSPAVGFLDFGSPSLDAWIETSAPNFRLLDASTHAVRTTTAYAPGAARFYPDLQHGRVWSVGSRVAAFQVTPTTLSLEFDHPATASSFGSFTAIDGSGNLWTSVGTSATSAQITFTDATLGQFDPGEKRRIVGLDARPGTGEVWMLVTGPGGTDTGARLRRVASDGSQTEISDDPALEDASVLAFIDGDELWMRTASDGMLRRLDADLLEAGLSVEESTLARAPIGGSWKTSPNYIVAKSRGAIFLCDGNLTYVVEADGSVQANPDDNCAVLSADGSGMFTWLASFGLSALGQTVREAYAPGRMAPAPRAPVGNPRIGATVVISDGSLLGFVPSGAIVRVFADGRSHTETTMLQGGIEQPLPYATLVSFSRDGSSMWMLSRVSEFNGTPDALWRFDLTTSPPAATRVADASTVPNLSQLEAAAPDGAFAWVVQLVSNVPVLKKIDPAGTLSAAIFTPPAGETPTPTMSIASKLNGGLCIADSYGQFGTSRTLVMRAIAPGAATTTTLGTQALVSTESLGEVEPAMTNPGACFVVAVEPFSLTTHIHGFTTAGLVRTFAAGYSVTFRPDSINAVWTAELDGTHGDAKVSLLRFAQGSANNAAPSERVDFESSLAGLAR